MPTIVFTNSTKELNFIDTNSFLKRGETYLIKITDTTNQLVYFDTAYVLNTNESISSYNINTNNYISNSTNNQYVIYG